MVNNLNLYFNDTSSQDIGLFIKGYPIISSPVKNTRLKPIKGKDGDLVIDEGTYKDRTITVKFNFIDKVDFKNKIRDINKWLFNITDNKLYFSDDPNYFYKVKLIDFEDIETELEIKGTFNVVFTINPYQFDKNSDDEITINSGFVVYSPYFIKAKPIIKLIGEGIVKLNVNGNVIEVNIGQDIIIDSELGQAYRVLNGVNNYQNTRLKGDFPVLVEGNNIITWTLGPGAKLTSAKIITNFKTI